MRQSPTIALLAEALSQAQGAMKNAVKDSDNPFFKSKYADLASVVNASREVLHSHGLAVVQLPTMVGGKLILEYVLLHSSGEYIGSELEMTPVKNDPQGIGSAITYARRYTWAALVGVATEDDDGNAASGNKAEEKRKTDHRSNVSTTIGGTVTGHIEPPKPKKEEIAEKIGFSAEYISNKDRGYFIGAYKDHGWTDDDIRKLLLDFNITSRSLIPKGMFKRLIAIVENQTYDVYIDSKTNAVQP